MPRTEARQMVFAPHLMVCRPRLLIGRGDWTPPLGDGTRQHTQPCCYAPVLETGRWRHSAGEPEFETYVPSPSSSPRRALRACSSCPFSSATLLDLKDREISCSYCSSWESRRHSAEARFWISCASSNIYCAEHSCAGASDNSSSRASTCPSATRTASFAAVASSLALPICLCKSESWEACCSRASANAGHCAAWPCCWAAATTFC